MRLIPFLALAGGLALVFVLVPQIDVAVSHLFYREGPGFFLRHWGPVQFLYDSVEVITNAVIVLVAALASAHLVPALKRFRVRGAAILYIALSLAIGPGLITNTLLKNNWSGRARPAQTVEFGGTQSFSPAFVPAEQCADNCSFVSGHASLGFFLVTFAFLMRPGPARRAAFGLALAFGALVGLGRMAQGAHYLSDVVFAGVFTYGMAWGLHEWLLVRDALNRPPFDRLGRKPAAGADRG